MGEVAQFKAKDDYSKHKILKTLDSGEVIELFDIDSMTEEQFKKFCRDGGTEYFHRTGVTV
jgi:hypothetical protein